MCLCLCLCGLRLRVRRRWSLELSPSKRMFSITGFIKESAGHLQRIFSPNGSLPHPGLYHYRIDFDGGYSRVHLRVNPDLTGCLVIDAAQMIHLNPAATVIAYHYLNGASETSIIKMVNQAFSVDQREIADDVNQTISHIKELTRADGACPIHELELETTMPFSANLDCALSHGPCINIPL